MTKRPNSKIFIGLTALTVVGGSFLSYMQWQSLGAAQDNVDALRKDAKNESQVQAELEAARTSLEETRQKLDHLEKGVSEVAYVPTFLKEIEKSGKEAGLTVLGVRPLAAPPAPIKKVEAEGDAPPPKKEYTEMNIEVRCRGNYQSVMNFTEALRMFPKIVAARTVSIQPKTGPIADGASQPLLEVTFELKSFVFPSDGKVKPAALVEEGEKTIDLSSRKRISVQ